MSSVDLSPVLQKSPAWRMQMSTSFLMRTCCLFLNSEMMTYKISDFILWECISSAMKLMWGKVSLVQEGNLCQKCQSFQQKQICPGYNIQQWWRPQCCFCAWQQNPGLLPPRQLLTPHLLAGRGTVSLGYALTAIFENIWLYPVSEQKKVLWECLWDKDCFQLSWRLNNFSKIYEDFFFLLICTSAHFTNERSVTACMYKAWIWQTGKLVSVLPSVLAQVPWHCW